VPIAAVLRDEIEVTRRYRELQSLPELEVGNMTLAWQLEVAKSVPEVTGDFYDWKINNLERQLINWPAAGA
jgi:hypothetical protein